MMIGRIALAGCKRRTLAELGRGGRDATGRDAATRCARQIGCENHRGEKLINVSFKRGAARRAAALDTIWEVLALNQTNQDFDEVDLSFNRFSNPFAQIFPHSPFPNGDFVTWDIPNWEDINEFAVGIIRNNQLVFSTGNLTRNADDGDLCSDTFDFVP
jgi:hypothetical protein